MTYLIEWKDRLGNERQVKTPNYEDAIRDHFGNIAISDPQTHVTVKQISTATIYNGTLQELVRRVVKNIPLQYKGRDPNV